MKKQLLGAVALLVGLTGFTLAADLPAKAPYVSPAAPGYYSWSGWNVGLNAGYVGATGTAEAVVGGSVVDTAGASANGFLGGAQLGYNWQFGAFVVGLESDIDGAILKSSSIDTVTSNFTYNHQLGWLNTDRARVGLALDRVLFYGTGGLAIGGVNDSVNTAVAIPLVCVNKVCFSESKTDLGWTAGGGVEWALSQQWALRAEGLYYDLGTDVLVNKTVPAVKVMDPHTGFIARGGLDFRF